MADWDTLSLANLQLTETEHRYYGDIFIYCCENNDCDTVPASKVGELLRSASLPTDVTLKVCCIQVCNLYALQKQTYLFIGLLKSNALLPLFLLGII